MSKIRNHAESRLRTHLMKRHKVKCRGTGFRRFPSADLYRRHPLPALGQNLRSRMSAAGQFFQGSPMRWLKRLR